MRRDLDRLDSEEFDLLVIGGGMHGACVAWDASLRGLRVALVEQHDFASGTTGNSLRVAHGGLRAIQQFAVGRIRQSAREQAILFRIAGGFLHPMPCLVPIYRGSSPGPNAFQAAFTAYRMLTADIQRAYRPPLPAPRVISAEETSACFEGFAQESLAGGALWYDAQVPDIERLVLAFVRSAAEHGAAAANYVRARRLLVEQGTVRGAEATDQRTGRNLRIRARVVANAAGPWAPEMAGEAKGREHVLPRRWALGVNIVIDRPPPPVAVGLRSPWGADRDPIMGGHRFLFLTGWKGVTLAGTSYRFEVGQRASVPVQVRELVEEWNDACPGLQWTTDEVTHHHCGRLPLRDGFQSGRPSDLLDRGIVIDHRRLGLPGLMSVVSTKFTTARRLAEQLVDLACHALGRPSARCLTDREPLLQDAPALSDLGAGVRQAIREEMAFTLEDIVIRRLGMGLTSCPPVSILGRIADLAAAELGWTRRQADDEVQQVLGRFLPAGVTRAA